MAFKFSRFQFILAAIAMLLLIPLIAMQFTPEVLWTSSDFVIMGFLLLGTGLLIELIFRRFKKLQSRLFLGVVVLLAFLLIWAELAVGVFGTPWAGS